VEEEEEVEKEEEEEIDHKLLENQDHQDSMPMETQSHSSQESQSLTPMVTQFHSSQELTEPRNTRVKIEKTVPVKPEEKERKVEKEETTRRRERKVKPPPKLSRKSRSKLSSQRNQKLSTRLSENLLMISEPLTLVTKKKRRKLENLKVSKVLKPLPEILSVLRKPKFFSKKLMLPTILVPEPVLDLWDSVQSRMTKRSSSVEIPEVEEEEEVEEAEEEEPEEEPEVETPTVVPEDKIQSKPSRKLKKISQPYEREDRFDLPSKELADSTMVINRLLIVLKRFV